MSLKRLCSCRGNNNLARQNNLWSVHTKDSKSGFYCAKWNKIWLLNISDMYISIPRCPQNNFYKVTLALHDFVGIFCWIWFDNCKLAKLIDAMLWFFHNGSFKQWTKESKLCNSLLFVWFCILMNVFKILWFY